MKAIALSGAMLAATVAPVAAATIDFTAQDFSNGASAGGVTTTLSASGGVLSNAQPFDGASRPGGLAFETDGFGVSGDEIRSGTSITVTFGRAVRLNSVSFLDLFRSTASAEAESALVFIDGMAPLRFEATEDYARGAAGFAAYELGGVIARSVVFSVDEPNDSVGVSDFALAGLDVTAVPLPAPFWPLAGAFAGVVLLRRKGAAPRT